MPEQIPQLPAQFWQSLPSLSLQDIAFEISHNLLAEDLEKQALETLVHDAINFPAPLVGLAEGMGVLELFHGPTYAFKDFGARFMARLMGHFLQASGQQLHILVATSGDTGSAVARGFFKVPGIQVTVLYPKGKVSNIQEKQFTTLGENITALEVSGTFDDCQRMVKAAFLDQDLASRLRLSSANSINISRLIPQSFYYVHALGQAMAQGHQEVVFCTPSGNFGNLCAGLLARRMGMPVKGFVAATNANHVVPDYLAGANFSPQPSVATISNAMDVGNPSNFVRLLDLYGGQRNAILEDVSGAWFTDEATRQAMANVYEQQGYIMCPHTAVGYLALQDALAGKHKGAYGILLSTAHPAKFIDIVEDTLATPVEIPQPLRELMVRPKQSISIAATLDSLKEQLLATA